MRWGVLLAGGSGTRFWPLSTPDNPKQLLPLAGASSTAEDAMARLEGLIAREHVLVVTGAAIAPRIRDRLRLPSENVLVEPRAASTAPALIDRKSTRLNSSHGYISYAVFCLKK